MALILLNLAATLVATVSAITLFFVGSAVGLVQDAHFAAGMAVVGALAGGAGGVLAAIGAWVFLGGRRPGTRGTAALCWLAWTVAGAAGGVLADNGLFLVPLVALVTLFVPYFVRANAAGRPDGLRR